ncbi:protein charlatan isoform X2 [Condylostylus longicornis]|uniref:protein charlatan isoform X2 n=1 Tax=Condylostylus longicornis TaxID=2530218 RepID=UPI00244E1E80|nr:protein charlatan isoform X2 [Condylostylus longicornis]
MATLIPTNQPSNVEAVYEDMFKEITRKLYGEETGNGLHTLGTPVAHVATTGPTAPEGERSFTTLISDRNLNTIDYEQQQQQQSQQQQTQITQHNNGLIETASTTNPPNFKSEDHLTTAFGLAALMQNGFHPAISVNNGNNNSDSSTTEVGNNNDQQPQQHQSWNNPNDHLLQQWQTDTKPVTFHTPIVSPKNPKLNKNKNSIQDIQFQAGTSSQPNTQVIPLPKKNKNNIQNTVSNQQSQQPPVQKRYSCTHCPYSTDRRDLYTRHENIHKDEKPFQCYACLKQFNRADHVKKHFLRMHRELTYDISKTRRNVNNNASNNNTAVDNNNCTNNTNINTSPSPLVDQKPINLFNSELRNVTNNSSLTEHFLNTQRVLHQASSSSIAQTIESVATATESQIQIQVKQEKISNDEKSPSKIKPQREKRFTCCYCPWSGADKWGLKRHLNTHTKPFVCMLCDYKAARSERLATHVLKVHNKKACNKCSFLADTQEEFQTHLNEVHPHDNRPSRSSSNNSNVLRAISSNTNNNNNQINNFNNTNSSFGNVQNNGIYSSNINNSNELNGMNNIQSLITNPTTMAGWRIGPNGSLIPPSHLTEPNGLNSNPSQKRGAERLFSYLEADGSDPEDYARQLKMEAISRNTTSVAQDFHNAGGVVNRNYKKYIQKNNVCHKLEENNTNSISMDNNVNSQETTFNLQHQMNLNNLNEQPNITSNNNCFINKIKNSNEHDFKIDSFDSVIMAKKFNELSSEQKKAMLDQLNKSPPAFLLSNCTNLTNYKEQSSTVLNLSKTNNSSVTINTSPVKTQPHRLEINQNNKENTNSIFANMEYQNLNKLNIQFQNYIKNIINKYYAETPLLYSASSLSPTPSSSSLSTVAASTSVSSLGKSPNKNLTNSLNENIQSGNKTETENYIEYLKNKEDITLIVQPKKAKFATKIINNEPEKPSIEILLAPKKKINELYVNSNICNNIITSDKLSEEVTNLEFNQDKKQTSLSITQNKTASKLQNIYQNIKKLPKVEIVSNKTNKLSCRNSEIKSPVKFRQNSKKACNSIRKRKQAQPKKFLYTKDNGTVESEHKFPITFTAIGQPLELFKKNIQKLNNIGVKKWKVSKIYDPKQVINRMSKLRDRHMRKLVDEKRICVLCNGNQIAKPKYQQNFSSNFQNEIIFPYHTKRSLRLHRMWKHTNWMLGTPNIKCSKCKKCFIKKYSLRIHNMLTH